MDFDDECLIKLSTGKSPVDNIQRLVQLVADQDHKQHSLFIEQLHLFEPNTSIWHEKARWIKFQETAEEDGGRWSKPHISLLTLSGLLHVKSCLKNGAVLLDLDAHNFDEVVDTVVDHWQQNLVVSQLYAPVVNSILKGKKKHLLVHHVAEELGLKIAHSFHHGSNAMLSRMSHSRLSSLNLTKHNLEGPIPESDSAPNPPSGKIKFMISSQDSSHDLPELANEGPNLNMDRRFSIDSSGCNPGLTRKSSKPHLAMYHMLKKLEEGTEGAVILSGSMDKLDHPAAAFVRTKTCCDFEQMLEVPVPIRFFVIVLVPQLEQIKNSSILDIGSHFGALLSDDVFACVAYRAKEAKDLSWAVDEYLSHVVAIPPGKWDRSNILEPSDQPVKKQERAASVAKRKPLASIGAEDEEHNGEYKVSPGLVRTGCCFGGLISDIKRKRPYFKSDIYDAFNSQGLGQCIASAVFMFFALLTNIVTFGGVMEKQLHNEMAVLETILSGLLCGVVFAFCSGQPMNILSATGPVLVFEKILYKICYAYHWSFMAGRFWVGMWTSAIMMVIVATDMSALVALITRYTEECFATLIGILFIVQAFEEIMQLKQHHPITTDPQALLDDPCICVTNSTSFFSTNESVDPDYCANTLGGESQGLQCNFHPDVFLMSFLLFLGTFFLILFLKNMKTSSFFPTKVRALIADFSSFLAIMVMTGVSHGVGLSMPTLTIPTKLQPTSGRPWIVSPFKDVPWFLPLLCILPALLFSILVFMDQQITAVIINRKDNKLKKGFGYHLDLFVLSLLIVLCSILGIPFFVAATVLSINHVQSLRVESETAAPGEKPQFLGIREQRITAAFAAVLIGFSILMAQWIRLIPTPVLYGVFLFMGYSSLDGQQLIDRIRLIFIPSKYQPDYFYLRIVPMLRVHLYTVCQIASLVVLFVIKNIKATSMLFPLMLIVIVAARKLLEKLFTKKELAALDHPVPTWRQLNGGRKTKCSTCAFWTSKRSTTEESSALETIESGKSNGENDFRSNLLDKGVTA